MSTVREHPIDTPLHNNAIKIPTDERRVPLNVPRLHFICSIVGTRGTGKTTVAVNLTKTYFEHHSMDKLYLISPTANQEKKFKILPTPRIVYEEYTDSNFKSIVDDIVKDLQEYEEYKRNLEIWNEFQNDYVHGVRTENDMPLGMFLALEHMGWERPTTPWKYGPPVSLIIMDDCAGTRLYRPDGRGVVNNFAFRHRHYLTNLIFISQTHTGGGVPRAVRANVSFLILFRCKDIKIQKLVAEECSGSVKPEVFIRLWNHATEVNQHDFFAIDFDEPDDKKRFRKNFDILLTTTE